MTQLQDQAASLQGSIAANAGYSADLGKNFQLAGTAAHQVALEIQDLAIKLGVPASELEHIFTDVLESGGLHFVKTMGDVVSLTELFAVAMQKVSTDAETQRRVMLEIPGLLNGTESANARILNVLGLTKTQWEQIRTEALAHGDLVEKLADLMKPYLSVVDEANLRQSRLIAGIELQGQKIAGAIALPLWGQFTGILQSVSNFIGNNTVSMESFGKSVIGVGEDIGALVVKIFEAVNSSGTLKTLFQGIGQVIVVSVFAVRSLLDTITLGVSQLAQLMTFVNTPAKWFNPAAWKDAFAQIQKDGQDAFNKIQDAAVDAGTALFAKGGVEVPKNLLDTQVIAKKDLVDPNAEKAAAKAREDAFRVTQENFRTELQKTREAFAESEADIKARQETGTISFHEATTERVAAIKLELDSIQKLVQAYTALAAKSGVKPAEITRFDSVLTDVGNAAQSKATVQTTSTLAADQANDEHITQAHLARLDQMELTHQRSMIAIYREEASTGLITKTELFDKEAALAEKEHNAVIANLTAELLAVGNNAKEQSRIKDEITAADQRYTDQTVSDMRIRTATSVAESRQLTQDKTTEQRLQQETDQIVAKVNARGIQTADQIARANIAVAGSHLKAATDTLTDASALLKYAEALGITGDALEKYKIQVATAQKAVASAQLEGVKAGEGTDAAQAVHAIFDKSVDHLHDAFGTFGQSVGSLGTAMQFFGKAASGLISAIQSGFQSGGVGGAIGGGLSSIGSTISQIGSKFGPAGAIVSGIGEVFSLFGSLFTSHAKAVAADIKKSVSDLMQQYSDGQTTLVATITGLEQERQDAISRLSGQKGGQDQLNQLLPQLDQQIAQLKQQQTQLVQSFEQSLAVLQTHSSVIGQVLTTWTQINKQVTDYINAGGDAAKAAQFLSLSLQQQLQTSQNSLNDGEAQAIQDAQQLNGLLTQRVDLAKQFAQQEFQLRNQDALERSANPAINAALTYQAQKAANDAQLTALDQQIALYTTRVSMEKQVFDLATSTADLQAQANKLNLSALEQTIQGWKDLQKIIASITQNSAGLFNLNPSLFNAPAATGTSNSNTINLAAGAITVSVTGADAASGQAIATAISKELSLLGRFGADVSYA